MLHEQLQREVEMDKFFRRGAHATHINPETGEYVKPAKMVHPSTPNRCRVLIARQPTLCMNLAHAEIRQTLVVERNGKQGTVRIVLCKCPKKEAPERFQAYVKRWREKESLV